MELYNKIAFGDENIHEFTIFSSPLRLQKKINKLKYTKQTIAQLLHLKYKPVKMAKGVMAAAQKSVSPMYQRCS